MDVGGFVWMQNLKLGKFGLKMFGIDIYELVIL